MWCASFEMGRQLLSTIISHFFRFLFYGDCNGLPRGLSPGLPFRFAFKADP
jgi:hypothetical protein